MNPPPLPNSLDHILVRDFILFLIYIQIARIDRHIIFVIGLVWADLLTTRRLRTRTATSQVGSERPTVHRKKNPTYSRPDEPSMPLQVATTKHASSMNLSQISLISTYPAKKNKTKKFKGGGTLPRSLVENINHVER